jgi:hypothetical protein
MGCKTVPKGMRADSFGQPGFASRHLDGFINDAGIDMMAPGFGWRQIRFPGLQDRSKTLQSFFHHLKDPPG